MTGRSIAPFQWDNQKWSISGYLLAIIAVQSPREGIQEEAVGPVCPDCVSVSGFQSHLHTCSMWSQKEQDASRQDKEAELSPMPGMGAGGETGGV